MIINYIFGILLIWGIILQNLMITKQQSEQCVGLHILMDFWLQEEELQIEILDFGIHYQIKKLDDMKQDHKYEA